MDFIFVPVVVTAVFYYIQIFMCEHHIITQTITYVPQFHTLVLPVIYLILALRKKHKGGIFVNVLLLLFCLSAFFGLNFMGNFPEKECNSERNLLICFQGRNSEFLEGDVFFDRPEKQKLLSGIGVSEKLFCWHSHKGERYIENVADIDERLTAYTVKKSKVKDKVYSETDIYYIDCFKPYYSSKERLAQSIYDYVSKNSKRAIIFGDLGFPSRGLNYELVKSKFNVLYNSGTYYILSTKNITPISSKKKKDKREIFVL